MRTSWPDPPPLFGMDEIGHPGEKTTWTPRAPRAARTRSTSPQELQLSGAAVLFDSDSLNALDSPPLPPEESPMAFDEIIAQYAPVAGQPLSRVAVFDLETTGIDVVRDRIVTAYVGVLDEHGNVIDERSWLADPGIDIPEAASAVHGISTERARTEGRPAADVVTEIVDALRALLECGIPVVAYNASFDFSVLKNEAIRHDITPIERPMPVFDPLVVDKQHDRFRRGKRTLDLVAAHYGVPLEDAHEASADAIAAGRVALAIAGRYSKDLPDSAAELHALQIIWAKEQATSLTEYLVKVGRMQPGESVNGSWPVK